MFCALHLLHDGFVALLVLIHFFPSDFLLNKAAWTGEFHSALQSNTCNSSQKWARFRPVTRLIEVNLAKHKQKKKKEEEEYDLHSAACDSSLTAYLFCTPCKNTPHIQSHLKERGQKASVFKLSQLKSPFPLKLCWLCQR